MKLTVFLWSLCVIAGPVDHELLVIARLLPSQPTEFNALAFQQGNISLGEPDIPPLNLNARAPVDPPAGAVFIDAKDHQWDQTNKNDADKRRVIAAWDMALTLIQSAMNQLRNLETEVLKHKGSIYGQTAPDGLPLDDKGRKLSARSFIGQTDPAYTQMFGADQFSIGLIHNNFRRLRDGITKQDAEGRDNHLIYLTAIKRNAYQHEDATPHPEEDLCSGTTQAFFVPISTMQWWRDAKAGTPNWDGLGPELAPPDNAYSINFCSNFFDMKDMTTELQRLKDGAKKKDRNEICNLKNIDSTARVLLHEWTHFPFTLDTNRKDDPDEDVAADHIGWLAAASNSVDFDNENQPTKTEVYSRHAADSYAQFAVYGYMNNLDACSGVHWEGENKYQAASCKIDIWPKSYKTKRVSSRWRGWSHGDRDDKPEIRCED